MRHRAFWLVYLMAFLAGYFLIGLLITGHAWPLF